ncbi:testicular spindle-associated protein SHCBP1L [Bufo bufo]|uniref:testicular spindle-associated protein SHCBP1L n=1 Tax=Bufo bufo TaxID=8384 RepID=UPI001ABDA04F|nr:testicular spindle-associated protein SHCBP1L [Bufo bufo]
MSQFEMSAFSAELYAEPGLKREENGMLMSSARPKIPKANNLSPFKYPFSPTGSEGSPTLRSVFASPRNPKMAGTRRVYRKLQLPPCLDAALGDEWEVEEPRYGSAAKAQPLPPIYVSGVTLSVQERISLYCDQILRHCKADEVDEALCRYLSEKLKKKNKWIGVWKANPELFFHKYEERAIQYVGLLVEVTCKPCPNVSSYLIARIHIAEPFSSNIANMQRELFDDFLEQLGHCVPLLEIYPIEGQDDVTCEIAQALEILRFFFDYLWRDWDDEENCENYSVVIEERIKLYGDIQDGNIPFPIAQRFKKTLEKYRNKHLELIEFQSKIKDDPSVSEAVDCWHKFYEVQMLSGLLKMWEYLRLRAHGPFFPRVLRRKKGPRNSGEVVTHVVAKIMTANMVKEYAPDTLIQQHNNLDTALENSYCGDTIVIFPGEYKAEAMAMLTEDITIKGIGKKEEIIIASLPSSDNFVVSRAQNIKIIHLTLRQKGTFDGIVVVESGHLALQDCDLQCDGTGVCVLTGAALTMKDCEISGSQGAGIEIYPGSGAILDGNKIHTCNNFKSTDGLASVQGGGIKLKVIPAPVVKLSNNHIYNNKGYGITIVQPKRRLINMLNFMMEDAAAGDRKEEDMLTAAIESLSLDIDSNSVKENSLGKVGTVLT